MNFLEERIAQEGIVKEGGILKVDSFLNHQIDVQLLDQIGREFVRRFSDCKITKVLTIEASGIAVGFPVAQQLGVPLVFAKKAKTVKLDGDVYVAQVQSYTGKREEQVIVSKKFLSAGDHVLIVDDFLANGCALQGLISLVDNADATVEGLGIVIEKGFQEGGHRLRNLGYRLESLAIIDDMDPENGTITFRPQD